MNKIILPDKICRLISRLADGGYRGYAVGGCVRDMLMGKAPHDFDITTDAFPSETSQCFPDCDIILTGLKHGTVTVVFEGENIEITTFRADGQYLDNRHPESVTFVRTIDEDLSRRDFTVNAMAFNPEIGLIDLFDGQNDIKNGIIKCVGDPDKRFNEDGLRILRAMRFASVLGFEVEENTAKSIIRNKGLLKNISVERIYSELTKLLLGDGAKTILTEFYGVLTELFGEIPNENIEFISICPKEHTLRYAALFSHLTSENAGQMMRALKTDNETHRLVKKLISSLDTILPHKNSERFEKDVAHLLSVNYFSDFRKMLAFRRAKSMLAGENTENIDEISSLCDRFENENKCLSIKDLAVDGSLLAQHGIPKSREMGEILEKLLYRVIEGDIENESDALVKCAVEMKNNR